MRSEHHAAIIRIVTDLARDGATGLLSEFLDHGVDVDSRDPAGNALLMLAAYHGRPECVAMLLDRGADPDLCNDRGQSPLAGALFKGEDRIVLLLRQAGADLDLGTPSSRDTAAMFGRSL